MALLLNGTPVSGTFSSTNTKVLNLTTTVADTIIVVFVANEKNAAGFTTTTITDDHGLTWTLRKQLQWTVTSGAATKQDLEEWWAHAPSAATYAITATLNQNTDDSCMVCFAVEGGNTSSPYDGNGSLPASASDVTGSNVARQVTGISTTQTNTFMFAAMANSINQTATTPTGFTNIASPNNSGGSLFEYLATDYKIQSAAQSGITVTEGTNGQNWGMIVDAIQEATSEVDIVAAPALGISEAASITLEAPIAASAALGVTEAATIDLSASLAASFDLGVSEAASLADFQSILASPSLGIAQAVTLIAEQSVSVSAALGASMAAALVIERDLAAAPDVGVTMSVTVGDRTNRQPVVVCMT